MIFHCRYQTGGVISPATDRNQLPLLRSCRARDSPEQTHWLKQGADINDLIARSAQSPAGMRIAAANRQSARILLDMSNPDLGAVFVTYVRTVHDMNSTSDGQGGPAPFASSAATWEVGEQ